MTAMDFINITFSDFPSLEQIPFKALACYFVSGIVGILIISR